MKTAAPSERWGSLTVKSYFTQDEIFIGKPAGEIYHVLVDFNNRHLWWKANRARLLNGGEAQEGTKVMIRTGRWLFPVRFFMRIKTLEPYRLIRLEVEKGPICGFCEWQMEPLDHGTKVRLLWNDVRPRGLLSKLLFAVGAERKHRQHAARGLAGLKDYLEKRHIDREGPSGV